jgi:hypothetical protein
MIDHHAPPTGPASAVLAFIEAAIDALIADDADAALADLEGARDLILGLLGPVSR